MKLFTVATKEEGYFDLLKHTANRWGYDLQVLGWQQNWRGFSWKLDLYIEAFKNLPPDEPVICVDGYDVVVIAPANEMYKKFKSFNQQIIFSGQRYFPNQRWVQKLADQVMRYDLPQNIDKDANNSDSYSRPCMGLLVGYAGELLKLFQDLIVIERQRSLNDDQTLLNIYYSNYPDSINLDYKCLMFQNLWRTRGCLYGKISSKDKKAEIEVFYDEKIESLRVRNKQFNTDACFIHAPFNLDMELLLKELNLSSHKRSFKKSWHYWKYSIIHHIKRAIRLYFPFRKRY